MRRLVIAVLGLLFVAESSGGGVALAQVPFSSQQSSGVSTSAAQRHAMDSGGTTAPPNFSEATKPHPHPNPELHRTFVTPAIRMGGILLQPHMQSRIPASLPPDPLAMKKSTNAAANELVHRASASPLAPLFTPRPLVAFGKASRQAVKPMTVGPTGGSGVTGENAWWPYVQSTVPGAGTWQANVATGNLIVADTDVDVPGRGLDLSYNRVYNSMSQHTFSNADNSVPDVYGEGWTSSADAHISYNSSTNVMTVWSSDGARYDFASAGSGAWTPPAGAQGTKLQWDGGCGYYWTLKSGIVDYFNQNPYGCGGASYAAYSGRLYRIYGRNHNNYIQFNYYWNGDASTINNLNHIVMQHADGQSLTLQFGNYNGFIELASVTRPDGAQITYGYDGSGDLLSVNLPTNNSGYNSHGFGYYSGYAHLMNYVTAPLWTQSSGQKGSYTWFDYSGSNISGVQLYGWANFTPDDGTNASLLGTSPQAQQISYMSIGYPSGGETQVTDSYGHATNYFYDGAGRTTEEDDFAGNNSWLKSYATWDQSLDVPTRLLPRMAA